MKVIFLDIEGVLNTKETYERSYKIHGYTTMIDLEIDKFRLEYLKRIIEETNAKIVLSSSFRYFFIKENEQIVPTNFKGKKLYDTFIKYGIEIFDTTPTTFGSREEQIKTWLSNNEDVESFVIIDDDPTAFNEYRDKLIQTSKVRQNYLLSFMKESTGLCEKNIDEAINVLNKKNKTLIR